MRRRQEDLSSLTAYVQGFAEQYGMLEPLLDALKGPAAHNRILRERGGGGGLVHPA